MTSKSMASSLLALPQGSFWMGESADDKFATDTERPRRRVTFQRSFAIGKAPVTVGEYRLFSPLHAPGEPGEWPVVNVTWNEAEAYCTWLNAATGQPFRLPSEAEWEYACRAGSQTCFSVGTEIQLSDANYLYSEQGERIGLGRRQAVGLYPANNYGLHDFHGNVCEFTRDTWHADFLGAPCDGQAWITDSRSNQSVIRGGAWDYLPRLLRSAWRDSLPRQERRDNVGFRLALTLPL